VRVCVLEEFEERYSCENTLVVVNLRLMSESWMSDLRKHCCHL
jgi:hypothetical protein